MPPLKSLLGWMGLLVALAVNAVADDWSNLATVSMTNATTPKLTNRYACYTDGRDIRCDSPSLYITTGGLVGINTNNPTTQLEVNGTISATNFVGDGSGLTNLSVSGDRITSGTVPIGVIVNSATSYISLTSGATTWGYFGSGASYLPTMGLGSAQLDSILTVSGTDAASFTGTSAMQPLTLKGGGTIGNWRGIDFRSWGTWPIGRIAMQFGSDGSYLAFGTSNNYANGITNQALTINPLGRVGVGTPLPTATLQVSGTFRVSTTSQGDASPSLFVTSAGNVAIGSVSPPNMYQLYVVSNSNAAVGLRGKDYAFINLQNDTASAVLGQGGVTAYWTNYMNGPMQFATSGTERMRIAGNGNVGIGTMNPLAALSVSGTISASDAIQVGQSTLGCSSGISGSIRYSTTSGTIQLCNGTGWISLSSGTSAGVSSLAALTDTNITNLAGRDYLRYDAGASKWVNISESTVMSTTTMSANFPDAIQCAFTGNDNLPLTMYLADVNAGGVGQRYYIYPGSTTYYAVFNSNGTYSNGSNQTSTGSYACASRTISQLYAAGRAFNFIGSANATNTTAGVSAVASLTDVLLTNLAGRDYLRYDAGTSKWVNISESTVMSTTTMANGWPDAIMCTNGSDNMVLYYNNKSGGVGYHAPGSSTATGLWVVFNTNGTYAGNTGLTGYDCVTGAKSITTLYAEGKGFNFIGNSNVASSALGDRITSGTAPVGIIVNSATSYISLTNGATTWGYLGAGNSYLPMLSAGLVSSTYISTTRIEALVHGMFGPSVARIGVGAGIGLGEKGAYLYYDTGNDMAQLQAVHQGTAMKPLALNAAGGNVSIGKNIALAKLDVNGTISASDAIQVSGSSLACSAGIKGAMRYSNTSSTIEYCQGTAWVSMGPSATAVPSFSVDKNNVDQTVTTNTETKLTWSRELYDTQNNFASDRYTPSIPGKYLFVLNAYCQSSTSQCLLRIKKNGNIVVQTNNAGANVVGQATALIEMNGSTDYVEGFVYHGGGTVVSGVVGYTGFTGTLLAMAGNGGGGGGTATPAGSTKDVQFNTSGALDADTGLFVYDKTNHRLGVGNSAPSEQLVVGDDLGDVFTGTAAVIGSSASNVGLLLGKDTNNWGRFKWNNGGSGFEISTKQSGVQYDTMQLVNGKVGVGGVSSPAATLQVSGTISASDAVQVSGSSLTCNSGLKGAMRYSNTSSTIEYCQGTAWTSMGPSDTSVVSFLVNRNGSNQTVTSNVDTLIDWTTKVFDTSNNFNLATDRFTPTVAGKYLIRSSVNCVSGSGYCITRIQKNGAAIASSGDNSGGSDRIVESVAIVDMNGTTDYVTASVLSTGTTLGGATYYTQFSGALLGPQAGGGGGGATPAGSSNDVQYNSSGALAADTGNFTYASGLLTAPTMATGGMAVTGQLSAGTISSSVVQVSGSSLTCGANLKGAMRYSNTSSTIEYCNSTAWVSMGPSATSPVAVRASKSSSQAISANTWTKVTGWTEEMDTNNNYASDRFTVTVPGKYLVTTSLRAAGVANAGVWATAVYKNGAAVRYTAAAFGNAQQPGTEVTTIIDAVANDYIETWVYTSAAQSTYSGDSNANNFAVALLAPQGGGGGGGATPAGSSNDVQYNSSGALAADTGNFTYASGVLTAPTMSTGAMTVTGQVSASLISTTYVQIQSATTVLTCNSGLSGAMRYTSGTMQVCNGTSWGNIGIAVPTGTIAAFSAASCPSGWTEYTAARGRFLRGIDNGASVDPSGTRAPANTQEDAIQNITGSLKMAGGGGGFDGFTGAFYASITGTNYVGAGWTGSAGNYGGFDASRVVRTSTETRPKNVAVIFCQYAGFQSSLSMGVATLASLSDVSVAGATNGQALVYSGGTWIASTTTGGASAASGTGAVQFSTGSNLGGDAGNFFWDNAAKELGIGTNAPGAKLDVRGTISASDVIQVSGSSLTCNSGLKGAMRYSNTSSTIEYCQGTAWISMGPSDTRPVGFAAHKNGTNQTVTSWTPTKLTWNTEDFDVGNNFNTGTGRFTPTVAGNYFVTASVYCSGVAYGCQAAIYKNGSQYRVIFNGKDGGSNSNPTVTTIVSMNGTTDYIEAWGQAGDGTVIEGDARYTNFAASLLGPQSGGGGGATPAGSSGDIQFNNAGALAADTGKLFWDATNDRLGVGTGTPAYPLEVNGGIAATDYYQSSDRNLKEDITQLTSGLVVVDKLNPVRFRWKASGKFAYGLIAQDVEQVLPEAVAKDGRGTFVIEYSQLTPWLIQGLKELKAANDNLEAENATLRRDLDAVMERVNTLERRAGGMR